MRRDVLLDRYKTHGRAADHRHPTVASPTGRRADAQRAAARAALAGARAEALLDTCSTRRLLRAARLPRPGCRRSPSELTALRLAVRERTRAATMFGYGPRYLHSTGQLHKGGPNTGVFVLVTATPAASTCRSRRSRFRSARSSSRRRSAISRRSTRPAAARCTCTCRRRTRSCSVARCCSSGSLDRAATSIDRGLQARSASVGLGSRTAGSRCSSDFVGLGKMGLNMVTRLARGGHDVVAFDRERGRPSRAAEAGGARGAPSLEALVAAPDAAARRLGDGARRRADRVHGAGARPHCLSAGDAIIDGGNTQLSRRRPPGGGARGAAGSHYVDAGTSGGIWGLEEGYCLMVGGDAEVCARSSRSS